MTYDSSLNPIAAQKFAADLNEALLAEGGVTDGTYEVFDCGNANAMNVGSLMKVPSMTKQTSANTNVVSGLSTYANVTITPEKFTVKIPVDAFSKLDANIDIRNKTVEQAAMSVRGQKDQIIIDALVSAAAAGGFPSTNTIAKTIGGSNTGMNKAKMRAVANLFVKNNVAMDDACGLINSQSLLDLVGDLESAQYNLLDSSGPTRQGAVEKIYGIDNLKVIGNPVGDYAGLSLASNTRQNFFWSKRTVAAVIKKEIDVKFMDDPATGGEAVFAYLYMGAAVVKDDGIVLVNTHEA
jgi:hypothetical protein